jgi:hypothetical protein
MFDAAPEYLSCLRRDPFDARHLRGIGLHGFLLSAVPTHDSDISLHEHRITCNARDVAELQRLEKEILPPSLNISIPRVQTQEITVRGNDLYTPHFTLPTNFSPTHQPTYFCLISRNAYIVTQNLNPKNAYIEGQRK